MAESKLKDSGVNFQRHTDIQGKGTVSVLVLIKASLV